MSRLLSLRVDRKKKIASTLATAGYEAYVSGDIEIVTTPVKANATCSSDKGSMRFLSLQQYASQRTPLTARGKGVVLYLPLFNRC